MNAGDRQKQNDMEREKETEGRRKTSRIDEQRGSKPDVEAKWCRTLRRQTMNDRNILWEWELSLKKDKTNLALATFEKNTKR